MNDQRVGDWMQTYSGRRFYPLDPRPEEIHVEDIAHALSLICRFGGHCRSFYSVAQHSVHVSLCANVKHRALAALLHDAAEAYIGDMVRPLKKSMGNFSEAENRLAMMIERRFGLESGDLNWHEIKLADDVLLATEARDFMGGESAGKWQLAACPLLERIKPLTSAMAECAFLDRFYELGGE